MFVSSYLIELRPCGSGKQALWISDKPGPAATAEGVDGIIDAASAAGVACIVYSGHSRDLRLGLEQKGGRVIQGLDVGADFTVKSLGAPLMVLDLPA